MTYKLDFYDQALKEWNELDSSVRDQFKQKLVERLETPHVISAKLRGSKDRYKIKLRGVGYPMVYEVNDQIVIVVAIGKRDKSEVYVKAAQRLISEIVN
jgi:mRNA interferase RelE/StbE